MKVRYLYSACIEIETNDLRILCDPWFTEGIYDGSWYQFPKIKNALEVIKDPDVIYISHIHPDHYDPIFLKKLFKKYGEKPVFISNHKKNYLLFKSRSDGIKTIPIDSKKIKNTYIHITPNDSGSDSDIDSALLVHCSKSKKTVLNLNDCIWNNNHSLKVKKLVNQYSKEVDLLALGYAGAGPYPQTYYNVHKDKKKLIKLAFKKKKEFFNRYKKYCNYFPSKFHLPFAGKYILGGKLHNLNKYRGVPDPLELTEFDTKAIILDDFGKGSVDLNTNKITKLRKKKYSSSEINNRIRAIKHNKFDYEKDIKISYDKINFQELIHKAWINALSKSELKSDYFFLFKIYEENNLKDKILINSNKHKTVIKRINEAKKLEKPISEISIDYRYLFGLLTRVYHWNNAEVGSMFFTKRKPDTINVKAQRFLNFLFIR